MNTTRKNSNGCLWIFLVGLMAFFGWIFMTFFIDINSFVALGIAVIVASILITKWIGKPSIASLIVYGGLLVFLFLGLQFLSNYLQNDISPLSEEKNFKKEEGVDLSTIVENEDTVAVYTSHRIWRDNYGNNFKGDLVVRERDYRRLNQNHNNWTYKPSSGHFWGNLYDYLDRTNTSSLDLVMTTFREIHKEKSLNQMEFAEMVVTCIQDIPYSFIFQEECLSAENYEPSIRDILEACPECCMGNVTYGIQNQISFLQNLKGDCDTRTVIIYSILKHFNYDVAILNSDFYRHSIIGINLPTSGIHKKHYGKKYVVWETTAKYYQVGKLPGNFNDITHWNVILTSK